MGPRALASELNMLKAEAKALIESFKAAYPCISKYLQHVTDQCKANGYVETILGRRR